MSEPRICSKALWISCETGRDCCFGPRIVGKWGTKSECWKVRSKYHLYSALLIEADMNDLEALKVYGDLLLFRVPSKHTASEDLKSCSCTGLWMAAQDEYNPWIFLRQMTKIPSMSFEMTQIPSIFFEMTQIPSYKIEQFPLFQQPMEIFSWSLALISSQILI